MNTWETTRARHGTCSGYVTHQNMGEQPCGPCWQAKSEYEKRRLADPAKKMRNRDAATAQARALRELRLAHEAEYAAMYLKHKAEVLAERAKRDAS